MITLHARYVVDERGNETAVLLDMDEYRKLLEEVEELEAIRAYDAAKSSGDEEMPFEQAVEDVAAADARLGNFAKALAPELSKYVPD